MKLKKSLLALSLALSISSMNAEAYSESELKKIHDKVEDILEMEIPYEKPMEDSAQGCFNIQHIHQSVPVDKRVLIYEPLIDSLPVDYILKDFLKSFVNENISNHDAAYESIIAANTAENQNELYWAICDCLESIGSGPASVTSYEYPKELVHVLDNRTGAIELPKKTFTFDYYNSYGNYRLYIDYGNETYFLLTDQNNEVLAYLVEEYSDCSYVHTYTRVNQKDVNILNIEKFLSDSNLSILSKDTYTFEDLKQIQRICNGYKRHALIKSGNFRKSQ